MSKLPQTSVKSDQPIDVWQSEMYTSVVLERNHWTVVVDVLFYDTLTVREGIDVKIFKIM